MRHFVWVDLKRAGTDNRKQTVAVREITDGVCCYSQPTNTCTDLSLSQTASENTTHTEAWAVSWDQILSMLSGELQCTHKMRANQTTAIYKQTAAIDCLRWYEDRSIHTALPSVCAHRRYTAQIYIIQNTQRVQWAPILPSTTESYTATSVNQVPSIYMQHYLQPSL